MSKIVLCGAILGWLMSAATPAFAGNSDIGIDAATTRIDTEPVGDDANSAKSPPQLSAKEIDACENAKPEDRTAACRQYLKAIGIAQ